MIYTAPFDPARERPRLAPAPDQPLPSVAHSPIASAGAPDKRLFLIGVAAGVIAALALTPNSSHS